MIDSESFVNSKTAEELRELIRLSEKRLHDLAGEKRAKQLLKQAKPFPYGYQPNEVTRDAFKSMNVTFIRDDELKYDSIFDKTTNPHIRFELGYSARDISAPIDEVFDNEMLALEISHYARSFVRFEIFENHVTYSNDDGKTVTINNKYSLDREKKQAEVVNMFPFLTMIDSLPGMIDHFCHSALAESAFRNGSLMDYNFDHWKSVGWSSRQITASWVL